MASNATVGFSSLPTSFTLTGDLNGPGILTLIGGKTFDMDNTWNYTIDGDSANGFVVDNGTLEIDGCTLEISGAGTATESEYVLVDYSSVNGSYSGSFAATNNLGSWIVDYDGTDDNLDCIVLVSSPAGAIVIIR